MTLRITNIDLVNAKTGRKLSWLDRAINNSVNFICSWLIAIIILAIVIFIVATILKFVLMVWGIGITHVKIIQ
jgi:hypothetical protein